MLLGVHVSTEGKIYEAFKRASTLGCNTMQIFSRNPKRWRDNILEPEDIKKFNKIGERFNINPVFIHIPYLINLASPNPRLYEALLRPILKIF